MHQMRSREGDGSTDVDTVMQSNLIKYLWLMGTAEYLQLAVY